jgi:hypothetical protein
MKIYSDPDTSTERKEDVKRLMKALDSDSPNVDKINLTRAATAFGEGEGEDNQNAIIDYLLPTRSLALPFHALSEGTSPTPP